MGAAAGAGRGARAVGEGVSYPEVRIGHDTVVRGAIHQIPDPDVRSIAGQALDLLLDQQSLRELQLLDVLWQLVDLLGCGGRDDDPLRWAPQHDPENEQAREALRLLKRTLTEPLAAAQEPPAEPWRGHVGDTTNMTVDLTWREPPAEEGEVRRG